MIRQIIPAFVEGLAAGVSEAQAAPAPDPARLRPQLRGLRRVLLRRYRAALRLDEPVLMVSSRRVPTMLSTFPEADPGSPRDGAGGSPGSDIANSLYPATSSTCRYLMPLRSIQCRPRL